MAVSPIMVHAHCLAETESPEDAGPVIDAHQILRAALSADTLRMARLRDVCRTGATPKPQVARRPACYTPRAKELLEASVPYLSSTMDLDTLARALLRGALDLADHEVLFARTGLSAETVRLALRWSDA